MCTGAHNLCPGHKSLSKIASSIVHTLVKLSMPDKFTSGHIYNVKLVELLTTPSVIQCQEADFQQNTFGAIFQTQVSALLRASFSGLLSPFFFPLLQISPSSKLSSNARPGHWITQEFLSCIFLLLFMIFALKISSTPSRRQAWVSGTLGLSWSLLLPLSGKKLAMCQALC